MLANMNGNIIPLQTPAKPAAEMSPTKEFLTFDTPASRRDSFVIQPPAPATPIAQDIGEGFGESPLSPTTPYYLSKGAQAGAADVPAQTDAGTAISGFGKDRRPAG